ARGVHALLDVDRQREEVDALAGLAGDDGAEDDGVTDTHEHRAVGLRRELARLQGHLETGRIDGTTDTDCVHSERAPLSPSPGDRARRGGSQLSPSGWPCSMVSMVRHPGGGD